MGLVVHKYRGPRKSLFGAFVALLFPLRCHGALPHTPTSALHPIHIIVVSLNTLPSPAACGGVGRVGTPKVAGVRLGLEAI